MEPFFWPLILLFAGVVIVAIEMFVPSGGVLGFLATACFIGNIVVGFMHSARTGTTMLVATSCIVPVVIVTAIRVWPNTAIGRRMLVKPPENPDDVLPDTEPYRGLKQLVGKLGRAKCEMLPGGLVEIDDKTYDAVSVGVAINDGDVVEVVDTRNSRLVVRPSRAKLNDPRPQTTSDPTDVLSQPIDTLGIQDPLA